MQSSTIKQLLVRLRRLRQIHGITQETFAEISGIRYKQYQKIESGRKSDLRLSALERIAEAYGIDVHELFAPQFPITKIAKKVRLRPKKRQKG